MLKPEDSLDLTRLSERYRSGELRPTEVINGVLERIAERNDDKVWIHLLPREDLLDRATELERKGPADSALFGVPFASTHLKDSIRSVLGW